MKEWHRLQILISHKQYDWLKAESDTRGKSIGEIIRNLVDSYRGGKNRPHRKPQEARDSQARHDCL